MEATESPITWKTVTRKVGELEEWQDNPRVITEHAFNQLVESLQQDGYHHRIMVTQDNLIIGGHQRKRALLAAGLLPETQIEVLQAEQALTPEQFARLNIRDNLGYGQFDFDKLANMYTEIQLLEWHFPKDDLPGMDFNLDDDGKRRGLTDDDDAPAVPVEPTTKLGDLYLLGEHRLLCGDSTNVDDAAKLMGGQKADMVFTDPPYNIGSHASEFFMTGTSVSKSLKDLKNAEWDRDFEIESALIALLDCVKDSFTAYVWTSQFLINRIWEFFKDHDYTYYLVWSKTNPRPSLSEKHPTFNTELCAYVAHGKNRVVNFPESGHFLSCRQVTQSTHGRVHPTQKPLQLIEPILEFSSNPNQNRKCYMMELDPRYCDVIVKRWEDFTGNKAIREN